MRGALSVASQARAVVSIESLSRELVQIRSRLQTALDRIEELEGEIGQKPDQIAVLCESFRLTRAEAKVLSLLLSRDLVTPASYLTFAYGFGPDCDTPAEKIFDVRICRIRRAFRSAGLADPIETVWGQGKRITPANKALLRKYIEAAKGH